MYEEAVKKLSTAGMYDAYAAFLCERVEEAMDAANAPHAARGARKRAAALTLALLRLYSRAADAGARPGPPLNPYGVLHLTPFRLEKRSLHPFRADVSKYLCKMERTSS